MLALAALPTQAWPWILAASVFAVHVAVKAAALGKSSLWLDEAVGVHLAQRNLAGILRASQGDTTPPLYYLVLAATERLFGIGEAATRWPSVVASALAAVALAILAYRTLGRSGAVVASLLFLASDVNLFFARQARPYALVVCLAVVSFGAFLAFRARPTWGRAALLAGVDLALVLTHYATVFIPVTQVVLLLDAPTVLWRFVVANVPGAAATLLWLRPVLRTHQQAKMGWLEPPGLRVGRMLGWYASGLRWPAVFLLLGGGALLALWRARRRGDEPALAWTFALWATAPVAMACVASAVVPCVHPRYELYVTPGLVLFWTVGLLSLRAGWPRRLGIAAACLLAAAGFGRGLHRHEHDWRGAAAFARAAAADRVLLVPGWEAHTLAYYLDRAAFLVPDRTDELLAAEGVRLVAPDAPPEQLDVAGARTVVLLVASTVLRRDEADRLVRALVAAGLSVVEDRRLPNVRAVRFTRPGAPARP